MAYTGPSIVDYLKSVGQPSDYTSRATLAKQKGIANYTGLPEQNTALLGMLRGTPAPDAYTLISGAGRVPGETGVTILPTAQVKEKLANIGKPVVPIYGGETLSTYKPPQPSPQPQPTPQAPAGTPAPNTLYEYYTSKGMSLPSISNRAKIYEGLGLGSASSYVGNEGQNKALLASLMGGTSAPPATGPTLVEGLKEWDSATGKTRTYTGGQWVDEAPAGGTLPAEGTVAVGESKEAILKEIARVEKEIAAKQAELKIVQSSDEVDKAKKKEEADKAAKLLEDTKKLQEEADKLAVQKQVEDLRESMGLDKSTGLKQPALPTLTTDFEALRSEKGVQAIENQINNLDKEIRDTEASLRLGLQQEEGKLAPMEIIGTRQLELKRQGQEQLDMLNRRKQTLVDELTTKNTLISNIMNLKQTDYANASTLYNNEFSKNIQLLTLVNNRTDKADQEAHQAVDDARANLTTLYNMFKDSNLSWDQLTSDQKLAIEKLEIKSGLPSGLATQVMNENPESKIETVSERTDEKGDVYFDILMVDKNNKLTLRSIYRGKGKAPSTTVSTTVPDVKTLTADQQVFINRVQAYINNGDATYEEAIARYPEIAVYLKP